MELLIYKLITVWLQLNSCVIMIQHLVIFRLFELIVLILDIVKNSALEVAEYRVATDYFTHDCRHIPTILLFHAAQPQDTVSEVVLWTFPI